MIIKIVVVGKTRAPALQSLQRDYLQRLRVYTKVELVALRGAGRRRDSRSQQLEKERILGQLSRDDFVVVLDNQGRQMSSHQLAELLQTSIMSRRKRMVFIIGGPVGLETDVRNRSDLLWSFSRLTFTHEMIRILLLEQLYRAWTLIRGEKYHK